MAQLYVVSQYNVGDIGQQWCNVKARRPCYRALCRRCYGQTSALWFYDKPVSKNAKQNHKRKLQLRRIRQRSHAQGLLGIPLTFMAAPGPAPLDVYRNHVSKKYNWCNKQTIGDTHVIVPRKDQSHGLFYKKPTKILRDITNERRHIPPNTSADKFFAKSYELGELLMVSTCYVCGAAYNSVVDVLLLYTSIDRDSARMVCEYLVPRSDFTANHRRAFAPNYRRKKSVTLPHPLAVQAPRISHHAVADEEKQKTSLHTKRLVYTPRRPMSVNDFPYGVVVWHAVQNTRINDTGDSVTHISCCSMCYDCFNAKFHETRALGLKKFACQHGIMRSADSQMQRYGCLTPE